MESECCSGFAVFVFFLSLQVVLSWFKIWFVDLVMENRWTFPRQRRLIARARSAESTPCTRLHNIRRERIVLLHRVSVGTIASNQDMEVRPSLCFTRRQKLPRRLCWGCNAKGANMYPSTQSRLECKAIYYFLIIWPLSIKYFVSLMHFPKKSFKPMVVLILNI